MKKITFLLAFLTIGFNFNYGQNLIVNGDFETGDVGSAVPSWGGFKNRIANDDIITPDLVGQVENGDGSLFQEISVTPGETYNVAFDYRWVTTAAANSNMTMRIKDANNLPFNLTLSTGNDGFVLNTAVDQWFSASFSVEIPAGINNVRILFFKPNGNKPLNLNNVSVELDATASVQDLSQFGFEVYPNPVNDVLNLKAQTQIEKVEIFNLLGQQVLTTQLNLTNAQINVSGLNDGVYLMRTFINGISGTNKFVKK